MIISNINIDNPMKIYRHLYNIWHLAKSLEKKLVKAAKRKDLEVIQGKII